ncbi:MAG: hypothetical protein GC184_14100 [Rhizobiales bacterium]|nr:hypothetical protein [Hyphomicrobiales bacterium]
MACGDAIAGGWPLAPGATQIIIPVTSTTAKSRYDAGGNKIRASPYRKWEIAPYVEYGLTKSLTLVGEAAWTSDKTNYFGTSFRNEGFTRAKLGARYFIGKWQETLFSLQPVLTIHGQAAGDNPNVPQMGDLESDIALILGQADTLLGMDIFSVQELAWQYHQRGARHMARADLTFGLKPYDGTMLLIKSLNTTSLSESPSGGHYQSTKLGLSFVQTMTPRLAFEFGYEKTLSGSETLNEKIWRIGLWVNF